ncbi:hypothetical protein SK128_016165 [Halocaridina rubra]|uniref:Uncharacterized protein n=1 Tax=Halocaridina rubra TaxID=373956 RepID=A0AAN8X6I8_HALRR
MASSSSQGDKYECLSIRMPELFAPVATIVAEAEKDFNLWKTTNQNLQDDIDELRKLVQSLTKSANEFLIECTKPKEVSMKADPTVKLRAGNTMNKVSLWETQKSTSQTCPKVMEKGKTTNFPTQMTTGTKKYVQQKDETGFEKVLLKNKQLNLDDGYLKSKV